MKYTFHLSTGTTIEVDIDFTRSLPDSRPIANAGAWLVDKNGTAVLMGAVIAMVPIEAGGEMPPA